MLKLEHKWVWDSWYCHDGAQWHAFFLQADKALGDPELRHWNATHGRAVSSELSQWSYQGTVLAPAAVPAFDDAAVWTGCVVRDEMGIWHLFYTGISRGEDGKIQRIGHATSRDLSNWARQGVALERAGTNAEHYEGFVPARWKDCSLRDPWVMRDPEGDGWLMYFTARSPSSADTNASGAVGLARLMDLWSWELQPPVFIGGFGEIEVPQVFKLEERCIACSAPLRCIGPRIIEPPMTAPRYQGLTT
jgi:beta-fructofuranosidase